VNPKRRFIFLIAFLVDFTAIGFSFLLE